MEKLAILYLSLEDVLRTGLDMTAAMQLVEEVLIEHGNGRFENPPKPGIHPRPDAFIHAMPGYLPRLQEGGIKWVSGFSANPARGLPSIMGLVILNDMDTGKPVAILDGTFITAIRTAAVSGIAARHLARAEAAAAGIVGAGIQARYHLLSLKESVPALEVARLYDINREALGSTIAAMQPLVPFRLEESASIQETIENADIVITATGHLDERIFKEAWVRPGALVLPVHTRGWERETPHRVDKFVVDDWGQFSHVQGGPEGYYAPLPELYAELGEIVAGKKPGRESDRERIINFNFGMAIHDIHTATAIVNRARDLGLGLTLPYMAGPLPLPG